MTYCEFREMVRDEVMPEGCREDREKRKDIEAMIEGLAAEELLDCLFSWGCSSEGFAVEIQRAALRQRLCLDLGILGINYEQF